jgi:hypothetical protein
MLWQQVRHVTPGMRRECGRSMSKPDADRGRMPGRNLQESVLRELVRTNDPVLISAIEALLNGAAIPHVVLDQNMSVLDGSIGALPRRLMVAEGHADAARRLLLEAGLGHELRPEGR